MRNYRCCFCGRSREKTREGFVTSKDTDEAICDSCITDIVILMHHERKVAEKLESIRDEGIEKS